MRQREHEHKAELSAAVRQADAVADGLTRGMRIASQTSQQQQAQAVVATVQAATASLQAAASHAAADAAAHLKALQEHLRSERDAALDDMARALTNLEAALKALAERQAELSEAHLACALAEAHALGARADALDARAMLCKAQLHACERDRDFADALERLKCFEGLPEHVCAIGRAVLEDRLTPFERELVLQLGSNAMLLKPKHSAMLLQLTGLLATSQGMAGARLLHANAPKLFPAETRLREELAKHRRPPVLHKGTGGRLEGFDGGLRAAIRPLREHARAYGYSGAWVFAHDATAALPHVEARLVGANLFETDCWASGPRRYERTADGARQLAQHMQSSDIKAPLVTLLVLHPSEEGGAISPFPLAVVAGSGPDGAETETWEQQVLTRRGRDVAGPLARDAA